MDFTNVYPAVFNSFDRAYLEGDKVNGEPGLSGVTPHSRLVCMFRVGEKHAVICKLRVANSHDFCGGLQMYSAEIAIRNKPSWGGQSSVGEGRVTIGDDDPSFLALPDYGHVFKQDSVYDIEQFAVYSMAHAVVATAHYFSKNGIMYQDRDGGRLDDIANVIATLDKGYSNVLSTRGAALRQAGSTNSVHQLVSGDECWEMDASVERATYFNRNSHNDVVNGTVVYGGGYYHQQELSNAGFYDDEEDWVEGDWCDCDCDEPPNDALPCTEVSAAKAFYESTLYSELAPRNFWSCG